MNLRGMTMLAWHGRRLGVDLWGFQTDDGRSIRAAYGFLEPFIFDGKPWKYEQLDGVDKYLPKLRGLFYRTGGMLGVPEFCALREKHNGAAAGIEALMFDCAQ